jgi:hypothetical protein
MSHEEAVAAFFAEQQQCNTEQYNEVCEKYPVQTYARSKVVRRRETTVGLLGLSPSRISLGTATRYDIESEYQGEG